MAFERPRELTDPRAMRAMAHPVRLALMEALNDAGTLTATEAAERVGESPSNCSFHLRQLAKYGFVEEAEGGTGRQRPWRAVHAGMRFTDVQEDPDTVSSRSVTRPGPSRAHAQGSTSVRRCRRNGGGSRAWTSSRST